MLIVLWTVFLSKESELHSVAVFGRIAEARCTDAEDRIMLRGAISASLFRCQSGNGRCVVG